LSVWWQHKTITRSSRNAFWRWFKKSQVYAFLFSHFNIKEDIDVLIEAWKAFKIIVSKLFSIGNLFVSLFQDGT
jgi:hypothetical protein